ncbi:hypothetical protein ACE6H2_027459 [Prunus campanulata]
MAQFHWLSKFANSFTPVDIAVTSVQRGVQKQESKIDASSIVGYALKSARYCSDKCSTRCAVEEVQDRCIKYCGYALSQQA